MADITGIIVGAYAASPAHARWDPRAEEEYLQSLADVDAIAGVELPWVGSLHPHDDTWLLDNLPRRFGIVVTDIGATVAALAVDPQFGLASRDDEGRRRALLAAAQVRDGVERLVDSRGRPVVHAVELHSAPLGRDGSAGALAESLAEVASWEWNGARLLLEHCDAHVEGQRPEKGYLSLQHELDAISLSGTDIGVSLNWGRSAIELRDASLVLEHVALARSEGRLAALVLSGAAAAESHFGPAWTDAHLPFPPSSEFPSGEPTSVDRKSVV